MTSPKSLRAQRLALQFCGVRIECLDAQQQPLRNAVATGFLRREADGLFLYTAWHVVTALDPHQVDVGFELPRRRYLRVALQDASAPQPGVQIVGGMQSHLVPLYENPEAAEGPLRPLWLQNDQHVPHELLNRIGLFVPFWHDVVKICLPDSVRVSDLQVIPEDQLMIGDIVDVGDKCLIVGFPYGFSAAMGVDQPTPVVFTRFVASAHIAGSRKFELFLDGYGAPGMSGGPVFLERDGQLSLMGIYTGDIYPDLGDRREKTTALGTVANISLMLSDNILMARLPSSPISVAGMPADEPGMSAATE